MSARHRVAKAMANYDPTLSYSYSVYGSPKHVYFVFDDPLASDSVAAMLRILFKRKPLIHKGKKP